MIQLEYTLIFRTPAFLGNADQSAQWRTPPFKAQLRHWWRMAYAADHPRGVDIARMRAAEGLLFGVAADKDGESRQSQVRIRLSKWSEGTMKSWAGQDALRITHPEVKGRDGRLAPVGAQLYLGYGPLNFSAGSTALKAGAAIQAEDRATLRIAFRNAAEAGRDALASEEARLSVAIQLMHAYGTVGGRNRNGWGSFECVSAPGTNAIEASLPSALTLPWRDALAHDWPQAIGTDTKGPLIWQLPHLPDWKAVMRRLAEIKIKLRTDAFRFTTGRRAAAPEARHWLSYPVTNHDVRAWDNLRLPNALRFKVRAAPGGGLHGVIFHVPCLPPPAFRPHRAEVEKVWQQVHTHLDREAGLQRIPA